jgi:phage terminase large subunit-like protein
MAIIAATSRDIRSTIVPAITACYPPGHKNMPYFSPAKSQVLWPNGAIAICISAESGEDAIRGLNNELIWGDETAFYGNNEGIIDQALLTLRLEPSIMLMTTTPKATPKMIELYGRGEDPDDKMVQMYTGSTYENMENLSDVFIDTVISKYEGTKMGETELQGKLILTNDAALWQHQTIAANTIDISELPLLVEICIGVDPSVLARKTSSKGRTPDKTGIIISGIDKNNLLYTIDGHTGSYTTEGWTSKVATLYDKYSNLYPTTIAIEINVLGEELIKMAFDKNGRDDVGKKIKPVFATLGKLQRAAPYSLLAEQGRIKYVDRPYLKDLAVELVTFDGTGKSPNNYDAAVWSWSNLQPIRTSFTQVFEFLI